MNLCVEPRVPKKANRDSGAIARREVRSHRPVQGRAAVPRPIDLHADGLHAGELHAPRSDPHLPHACSRLPRPTLRTVPCTGDKAVSAAIAAVMAKADGSSANFTGCAVFAVSYTHLTLPTILLV